MVSAESRNPPAFDFEAPTSRSDSFNNVLNRPEFKADAVEIKEGSTFKPKDLESAPEVSSVTFKVDDVKVGNVSGKRFLTAVNVRANFLGTSTHSEEVIEACELKDDDSRKWVSQSSSCHGFFAGALAAFDGHYPFTIKPDHIFQLILEGWSQHVDKHPEELRACFVSHEGKKTIRIRRDDFVKGSPTNPWPEMFAAFSAQIKANTTPGLHAIAAGTPFTTTTPIDQIARDVSLMSLTKHYFDFRCSTCCGFPEITLQGTLSDWILLKQKVTNLRAYMTPDFADKWIPSLQSILDKFVEAYQGKVDKIFWSSMVKYYSTSGSGGDTYFTGWINILFPYVNEEENRLLMPWKNLEQMILAQGGPHRAMGNSRGDFGHFFCAAPVTWEYYSTEYKLKFKTGFIGSMQDPDTGNITPQVSWAVVEELNSTANCRCYDCRASGNMSLSDINKY